MVTIRDVAREAGVSVATVSRALNNGERGGKVLITDDLQEEGDGNAGPLTQGELFCGAVCGDATA